MNEPPSGKQWGICCNYFLIAASDGELTQAPQPQGDKQGTSTPVPFS